MSKQKIIPAIAIVVILVLAFLVKRFYFPSTFYYAGTIEVTKVDIPARVSSVIQELAVKEGEKVLKNQRLIKLSCEDIQVAYELANITYQRMSKLVRADGIPRDVYDQSKAKKDDLQIRYQWCDIASPLNGTVLTKYHEVGEMVGPGTKLLTIGDLDEVYAYFYLPHDKIAGLKLNQKVQARLPEMESKSFAGVIEFIDPEAEFTPKNVQTRSERTRLVFGVKIRFKNREDILKPGMTLEWSDGD